MTGKPDQKAECRISEGWLKLIGHGLTATAIVVSIITFGISETNKVRLQNELLAERDRLDFERRLWLEKLEHYRKAADAIGTIIAVQNDPPARNMALTKFLQNYWGTLVLVEDRSVAAAMKAFRLEIDHLKSGMSPPNRLEAVGLDAISSLRISIESRESDLLRREDAKTVAGEKQ